MMTYLIQFEHSKQLCKVLLAGFDVFFTITTCISRVSKIGSRLTTCSDFQLFTFDIVQTNMQVNEYLFTGFDLAL